MRQVIALECPTVAISQDEREFFIALGARIARLRKQLVAGFQGGRIRLRASPMLDCCETG